MGKDDREVVANLNIALFIESLNCIRSKIWPCELRTIADYVVIKLLVTNAS
jgi:hypothetical protein